jgi:hypothetical protein
MPQLQTVIDGGLVPAHLTTGLLAGDILIGVGVALVLFGLYYRLVLKPARRNSSGQSPRLNDTSD